MTTATIFPGALGDDLDHLMDRVYAIEQRLTNPNYTALTPSNPIFDSVTIGDRTTGTGTTVDDTASPPTGMSITPGAFLSDVYADVSWTAPVDGSAVEYEVQWAKKVSGVYQQYNATRTTATNLRLAGLVGTTTYGVRVYAVNALGIISTPLPATGYTDFISTADTTIPSQVTGVVGTPINSDAVVTWNDVADTDVRLGQGIYIVDYSTSPTFASGVSTVTTSGTIVTLKLGANTTYYVRVSAKDASGNTGTASTTVSFTTGDYVPDNTITSAKIVTIGLDAAVIKFGTMSGARLTANTADIGVLKTSSLTTQTITLAGGSLIAGNPGTGPTQSGVLVNSQGLRSYANGVLTGVFDVTGSVTLTGATVSGALTATSLNVNGATISGTATVGGLLRIGSAATYHAEIGVNGGASGIRLYASDGTTVTINLDATTGTGTFTGLVQTGTSGQRIVLDPIGIVGIGVAAYFYDAASFSQFRPGRVQSISNNMSVLSPAMTSAALTSSLTLRPWGWFAGGGAGMAQLAVGGVLSGSSTSGPSVMITGPEGSNLGSINLTANGVAHIYVDEAIQPLAGWTNVAGFTGGWTVGSPAPAWRQDALGNVRLSGRINSGTLTDATTITPTASPPPWPARQMGRLPVACDNGVGEVFVGTSGLQVFKIPAGAAWIDLGSLSWPTS